MLFGDVRGDRELDVRGDVKAEELDLDGVLYDVRFRGDIWWGYDVVWWGDKSGSEYLSVSGVPVKLDIGLVSSPLCVASLTLDLQSSSREGGDVIRSRAPGNGTGETGVTSISTFTVKIISFV
jgi:hypothetical protein